MTKISGMDCVENNFNPSLEHMEHFKLPHLKMAHSQMECLSAIASELRLEYESIWYDTLELNCQMRYGADSHRKSNN